MESRILEDPEAVAREAGRCVADALRAAVDERGFATVAFSGGRTPARMFERLACESLPWSQVHVFQTDERIAASGDPARNAPAIRRLLTDRVPVPEQQIHLMPVECAELDEACRSYESALRAIAGSPPVLDLVHLGLGEDGHTASLFPGDAAAARRDRDVVITAAHGGWRRMTLTAPVLERARQLLWVVCGAGKRRALAALLRADAAVPAGRLPQERARVVADRAASAQEPDPS